MGTKVKLCWAKPSATLIRTAAVVGFSAVFGMAFFLIDLAVTKLVF